MVPMILLSLLLLLAASPALAATQSVPGSGLAFPQNVLLSTTLLADPITLADADDKAGTVGYIPKTGTITHLVIRIGTVTTAQTLRSGLYTVDDTNGNPTTTFYGSSSAGTQTSPTTGMIAEIDIGDATATAGDLASCVTQFDAWTNGNLLIDHIDHTGGATMGGVPYSAVFTTAWAQDGDMAPVCGLKYNDGTYANLGLAPPATVNAIAFNNGSVPDEIGLKCTFTSPIRISGVYGVAEFDGNMEVVLYDSVSTAQRTSSFDNNVRAGTGSTYWERRFTPYQVASGATVRLVYKPTVATNTTILEWVSGTTGQRDLLPMGTMCLKTFRTDAGAWDDTATTSQIAGLGFFIDGIDDGVGAASSGGGAFSCFEPSSNVVGFVMQFPGTATGVTASVLDPDDTTTASFTPTMTAVGAACANCWRASTFALPSSPTYGIWTIQYTGTVNSQVLYGQDLFEVSAQCPIKPVTAGRKLAVDATGIADANVEEWNANLVPAEDSAGHPKVTIKDGTATGEIDTLSGQVIASSVQGNVTGSVAGSVGSVTGSVGSVGADGITSTSIASGAIDPDAMTTALQKMLGIVMSATVAASPAPTTTSFAATAFSASNANDLIGTWVNCGDGYKPVEMFDPVTDQIYLPFGRPFGAAPTAGTTCYLRWGP